MMKLNWRHKAGLFLALVAVGCGLFLECSAKQAAGIALLGIAFAWLIGTLTPRTLAVTFSILLCAVGLYVAVAPAWSDWNFVRNSAAQYLAIADLQSAVKGALFIVSIVPTPTSATIDAPQNGAKPKKRGQYTNADIAPTRVVTIPDSAKQWVRPEMRSKADAGIALSPRDVSDPELMEGLQKYLLLPRPTFALGSSVRAHPWNVFGGLALCIPGLSVLGWSFRRESPVQATAEGSA